MIEKLCPRVFPICCLVVVLIICICQGARSCTLTRDVQLALLCCVSSAHLILQLWGSYVKFDLWLGTRPINVGVLNASGGGSASLRLLQITVLFAMSKTIAVNLGEIGQIQISGVFQQLHDRIILACVSGGVLVASISLLRSNISSGVVFADLRGHLASLPAYSTALLLHLEGFREGSDCGLESIHHELLAMLMFLVVLHPVVCTLVFSGIPNCEFVSTTVCHLAVHTFMFGASSGMLKSRVVVFALACALRAAYLVVAPLVKVRAAEISHFLPRHESAGNGGGASVIGGSDTTPDKRAGATGSVGGGERCTDEELQWRASRAQLPWSLCSFVVVYSVYIWRESRPVKG